MLRYYKKTEGEKLLLIGIGEGGDEISREEYDALLEEIRNTPIVLPEAEEVTADGSD
ncbi:MAG: hypothetical protein IJD22_07995 [Clostridia bacterium]|nr:hypothetical protein [Clostridia bacterium]